MNPITDIYSQLLRDEGCRLLPYKDTRGFNTIGIGHNLDANPLPFSVVLGISLAQAQQILHDDVQRITTKLVADLPWLTKLDDARFGVFANMAFNLGAGGIESFHHDLSDTMNGDFEAAANDMESSLWYKQVGARAERLVQQMRTGQWT